MKCNSQNNYFSHRQPTDFSNQLRATSAQRHRVKLKAQTIDNMQLRPSTDHTAGAPTKAPTYSAAGGCNKGSGM